MRKARFALAACLLALLTLLCACGGKSRTVMINQVSNLYYNGVTMEVSVRELYIQGNDASARVRFLNRSDDTMSRVGAVVEFLDKDGGVLYTDELSEVCDYPIPTGDGVALTATCSGRNVQKIASVRVSDLKD